MTLNEAREYAQKLRIDLSSKDLEKFFKEVGTLPLQIKELSRKLSKSISLFDIINEFVDDASIDLVAFIHQPILKELKLSPNGVSLKRLIFIIIIIMILLLL